MYDITTSIKGTRKKITLRKASLDKKGNTLINKRKQINSFIPNFVHSFDASHIILILLNIERDYKFNVVTIHDCFGCQANYAELLGVIVKETFIAMYIDKECINKFHNHILNYIKLTYKLIDNKTVLKNNKLINIPSKPDIGELEINKVLPFSATFTN